VRELNHQRVEILRDKDTLLQQKEFSSARSIIACKTAAGAALVAIQNGKSALGEARRRVRAVALVHRWLYRGDQVQTIGTWRYTEELCANTSPLWVKNGRDTCPLIWTLRPCRSIGCDHGARIRRIANQRQRVCLWRESRSIEIRLNVDVAQFRMIVTDKGRGRAASPQGFGWRMMEGSTAQLGGNLTYCNDHPGLRAAVTAPVKFPPEVGGGAGGAMAPGQVVRAMPARLLSESRSLSVTCAKNQLNRSQDFGGGRVFVGSRRCHPCGPGSPFAATSSGQ
jgi:two-component system, chemotaxis family, sensor kinase Cph1